MTPVLSPFKFKPLKEEIQQIAEIPIIQEPLVDEMKSEDMLETIENKLEHLKLKNTNEFIPFPNKEVRFRMSVTEAGQPKVEQIKLWSL